MYGFVFEMGELYVWYLVCSCSWSSRLTVITQLVHHGMIFVPVGYTFGAGMFEMEQVKGGSPYSSGTIAGNGSRVPTELELQQAFHQGKYFAGIAKKLKDSP
jgi:NAD(P)H dehydrogenase (quinone)